MNNKNKMEHDSNQKLEIAKKIATQSKRVSHSYANAEALIFRFLRYFSSLMDRLVFGARYLGLVSLGLTVILYLIVNYDDKNNLLKPRLSSAKTLMGVNINARYNNEAFELSGLPSACQVILTGDGANVSAASTKQGYCLADLEGYAEGTHTIKLSAMGYGNNVNTTTTPSQVSITLKKKTTEQFTLDYDFLNRNQMDARYILGVPEFADNNNKVNIRASRDTLNSIAMVKALIDVAGQVGDFSIDAPLAAYDRNGQVVKADIDPSSVKVKVSVTSPNKTVPIKLILSGEVPNGLSIEEIKMDHQTTTIYAPEKILNEITSVSAKLDVSTLISDSEIIQPIILPSGVSSSDITNVTLKTVLKPTKTKTLKNVPIIYRNNDRGYGAKDIEETSVDVTLQGTEANIDKVKMEDVVAYIDIKDLKPGTYDLPLQAEIKDNLFVKCRTLKSQLHITLVANGE